MDDNTKKQRLFVVVHLGPKPTSKSQQCRITNTLKELVKTSAAKLKMSKKKLKTASLHHLNGTVLTTVSHLVAGEELLLCTKEQSFSLSKAVRSAAQSSAATHNHRLPALPEVVWQIIMASWCEQEKARHAKFLRTRISQVVQAAAAAGRAHLCPYQYVAGGDAEEENGAKRKEAKKAKEENYKGVLPPSSTEQQRRQNFFPCRQAAVLSCVCRSFHRIIGRSRELDLLGQWFWLNGKHWIPYSEEASWDLEVAKCIGKKKVTVAICEALQSFGRRRHILVDLSTNKKEKEMIQRNLNGKGKSYKIKRLPCDILGDNCTKGDGDGDVCTKRGRHIWKVSKDKKNLDPDHYPSEGKKKYMSYECSECKKSMRTLLP